MLPVCSVQVVSEGFTAILPHLRPTDVALPDLTVGQSVPLVAVDMAADMTSPPEHLSEAELISLMEKCATITSSLSFQRDISCFRAYSHTSRVASPCFTEPNHLRTPPTADPS